ncbi:MAG: methyltransferase domain-containing protein [Chloroflexota bacterium]|nr:methyltransferase domain-containing protein [Chloroflexota bacterium]
MAGEFKLPWVPGQAVIELGGGESPVIRPNVDSRWIPQVDLVADFNWPLPLASNAYEGVFSKFLIEHLRLSRFRIFISEVYRILKPGGTAIIVTANLEEQMKTLLAAEEWNDDLICMVFGGIPDEMWNYHRIGFSPKYAEKLFKEAGFHEVKVEPWPAAKTDMYITATKSAAVIT